VEEGWWWGFRGEGFGETAFAVEHSSFAGYGYYSWGREGESQTLKRSSKGSVGKW
jgi:hypothetical protein